MILPLLSPYLLLVLATAAPAADDAMISGNWIIGVIGALASGGALLVGKWQGRKEALTIKEPVPTVPTSKVSTPPTWSDHKALAERVNRTEADILRIEGELKEMRVQQTNQFQTLMAAGAEREARIGDKIEGFARAIHARVDDMMKTCQAMHSNNNPPSRRR